MISNPAHHPATRVPALVVAAWQTDARSNGGLESLSTLLEACDFAPSIVITNRWSAFAERWARLAPVEIRSMVSGAERRRSRLASLRAEVLNLVRNNLWIARRLARFGHPVLHCNDEVALMNFGIGARLAGCPVLFHVRDTRANRNLYRVLRWRFFLFISSRFVTLSSEMMAWWLRYLRIAGTTPAGSRKLRYLYSIVSKPPTVRREEPAPRRSASALVVGIVGVFSPKKAQLELIEQCCRPLSDHDIEFRFFGDLDAYPDYAERCRRTAGDMLGRSVHFMGHVDDLNAYYHQLDVVVIASRHEGLARAMIEALAAGVPVLSFAVCSAREILAEEGAGIVVPMGDYAALVRALRDLASDRSRLAAMSSRARTVAERRFAPVNLATEYRHLLEELCDVAFRRPRRWQYFRTSANDGDLGDFRVRDRL